MEKDNELKRNPHYQTANLRERVNETIKRICDEGEELKGPYSKKLTKQGYGKRLKDQGQKDR